MKYFLNKSSAVNNLIVISAGEILVDSCDEKNYESIESQLFQGLPLKDILSKSETITIELSQLQKLNSRSTDDDMELSFMSSGKEEEVTLVFESAEQKQLCFSELQNQIPSHLLVNEYQQGKVASIMPPMISLILASIAFFLYYEKLPKTSYILGSIWAIVSLFTLYKRFSTPPVITRWAAHKSKISKSIGFLKQVYAWGFLLVALVVGSQVLPDHSGSGVIYDHAVKEKLHAGNIASLLEKEGDINFKGNDGKTALHYLIDQASYRAYEIEDSILTKFLLKSIAEKKAAKTKINFNNKKYKNEPEKTAIALIKAGADVGLKDSSGVSIMQYAIENYAEDTLSITLFEVMLKHGAKLDFVMGEDNMTPYEYVKEYTKKKILDKKHLSDLFLQYQ